MHCSSILNLLPKQKVVRLLHLKQKLLKKIDFFTKEQMHYLSLWSIKNKGALGLHSVVTGAFSPASSSLKIKLKTSKKSLMAFIYRASEVFLKRLCCIRTRQLLSTLQLKSYRSNHKHLRLCQLWKQNHTNTILIYLVQ